MVAREPAKAAAMGRAGRAHVAAKFSRDAFGAQLDALCRALHARVSVER